MKRGVAALTTVVVLMLVGCSGESANDTPVTAVTDGTVTDGTVTDGTVTDGTLGGPAETNPEPVVSPDSLPPVCRDDSPVVTVQVGTVNTIVVPANTEDFDGAVVVSPDTACPGDAVSFVVSIVNVSEEAQRFTSTRGLIFHSGGMANWELAPLSDLEATVPPGGRLEQTVTGTIPPVAAGTYRVSPEGAQFSGKITILDPTAGQ